MKAQDSFAQRARDNKRKAKKFKSPKTDKMPGLKVPDANVSGKYVYYFFSTSTKRNKAQLRLGGEKIR